VGFNPLPAIKPGDTLFAAEFLPSPTKFQSTPGD